MFMAVGHPVQKLRRDSYSFLNIDGVQSGKWRALKVNEISRLKRQIEK